MTIACLESLRGPSGFVELKPRSARQTVLSAVAKAAAEAEDAKVFSLVARRLHDVDLDAEFADLAADEDDWATLSLNLANETWPAE